MSNMNMIDVIVVGAGVWGGTAARILAEAGRHVLVLERRPVIGGNVRCETDERTGIEVHSYGSHIFHTSNPDVWRFVNRFTAFNGYQHKVLARHGGKTYFLPLGLTLINKFFGVELAPGEVSAFMKDAGREEALFDAFFRNYTSKQWGMPPEMVDASIIRRVPVRRNYDVNYFTDYLQGIPTDGYNSFFERLFDHPRITVRTRMPFRLDDWLCGSPEGERAPVFYTGPVDELFGYRFGPLPWRSLRFELERRPVADVQGASVVNYVDADVPFTRIHEFKHYHPENQEVMSREETILCREYPKTWSLGDEPYYPVMTEASARLLAQYQREAARIPSLVLGGRLGLYRYFDMDKAIANAMETVKAFLG